MLETTVQPGTNIVTLDYRGGLSVEDEQRMRQVLDGVIRDHGSIRMLAVLGRIDVSDISPRAAWMDLKAAGYLTKLDRLAVVTDAAWAAKISEWTAELVHVTVRTFPADRRSAALAWLAQP
ncbi:STAS/SEC14 domain-containing protein [Kocuria sp. CPCC 205268]|uniref:STAS/SEC14 domain-containing protein n=1 Tax=Kocuria oxytropis TaxID=3058913 RepID=UPI0034D723B1